MSPILGLFPRFYSRRWDFGSAKEGSVLSGGDDADVEGHFGAVNPVANEDVGGPRLGPGDEAGHFLGWIEGGELGFLENLVLYSVMSTSTHPVVITAMHSMVAKLVLSAIAMVGPAI